MQKHNGLYYLIYSGGGWRAAYGMGYATSAAPTGPFTKSSTNPILAETADVFSPGGGDVPVIGPNGATWMLYHGRESDRRQPRMLRIDRFSWRAVNGGPDVPAIAGPTVAPQPTAP
jgi:beta-xylosidase